jgi:hypothetical protein
MVSQGSLGLDRFYVVMFGAAGSLQRIVRVVSGTERWGLAVEEFNG